MEIDDLVTRLHVLGLEEAERELYVRLLQLGPSKASSVASVVEMSRSSVYRTLDALAERGYVNRSPGRPTLYTAEDPETVFEMAIGELKAQSDRIEHTKSKLLPPLRNLGDGEETTTREHWKRVEGPTQVGKAFQTLVQRTEETLWFASTLEAPVNRSLPYVDQVWTAACEAAAEGVRARALFATGAVGEKIQTAFSQVDGAELRTVEREHPVLFAVGDGREVVMWARQSDPTASKEEPLALWTTTEGIVAQNTWLFELLWERASAPE